MALGSNGNDGLKRILMRLRSKDGLRFDIIEKQGDEYIVTGEEKRVTGKFDGVFVKNIMTSSWEEMVKVNLKLKDEEAGEKYTLDISPSTSLGRSAMNTLLDFEDNGEEMEVSLYETSKEGRIYNNISIRQGGQLCGWKYKFDELPKPTESTVRGKTTKDYFDTEVKLLKELTDKYSKFALDEEKSKTLDEVEVPEF